MVTPMEKQHFSSATTGTLMKPGFAPVTERRYLPIGSRNYCRKDQFFK